MKTEATVRRLIANLDLVKIRKRVKKENPDWDAKKLKDVENQYRGFLFVIWKYPKLRAVPSMKIDEFWHAHILYTQKYMKDCNKIYGKYIHHTPTS